MKHSSRKSDAKKPLLPNLSLKICDFRVVLRRSRREASEMRLMRVVVAVVLTLLLLLLLCSHLTSLSLLYARPPLPWSRIVQWGEPRSASTTQYYILLCMATVRNITARPLFQFWPNIYELRNVPNLLVVKTHETVSEGDLKLEGVMLFTSSRGDKKLSKYSRGHWNAKRYFARQEAYLVEQVKVTLAPLFHLTEAEIEDVLDYMKKWDVMRRCCGFQSASKWMKILQGAKGDHFCLKQNLQKAEAEFLSTNLATKFVSLRTESDMPKHYINGSWCEWSNRMVKLGAGFNGENAPMGREILGKIAGTFHAQAK